MRFTHRIAPYESNEYLSNYYYANGNLVSKFVSSSSHRYTLETPSFMALDIGGKSNKLESKLELNLSNDNSWDFGQSIGTWQAGHEYSVGDWVKAVAQKTLTRPGWSPGGALICSGTRPTSRGYLSVTIYDGYMYIFGGNDIGGRKNDVHRLNLSTLEWSGELTCTGTPPTIRNAYSLGVYDGYMYIFGGNDIGGRKNDVHRLNLSTLEWSGELTCTGTPPTARDWMTAVIHENYMYIFGGYDTSNLNDVHRLNLSTLEWSGVLTITGTPPIARRHHSSVVLSENMYVFGGYAGSSYLNDVHRLNLSTLEWSGGLTCTGTKPVARGYLSLVVCDGYMYVFGGGGAGTYNDVHRLKISTLAWSGNLTCSGISPLVRFGQASCESGGFLYVFGGMNSSGSPQYNDTHRLNLTNNFSAYKCTTLGTSLSSEPSWSNVVDSITTESGGPVWTCYQDNTKPDNRAGQDYYIYACQTATTAPKLLASRNSTYPHGYTASNSRKIGGFHCLCNSVGTISGHDLTGYLTGDILPRSVWDLNWRAKCGVNSGLVYSSKLQSWVGIYLISGSTSFPSHTNGGTILDTITWFTASSCAKLLNMRLPKDYEFQIFANGSPESVNIYGSADPVITGGYISTGSVRMISNIGCEGCAGQMYQWLDETNYFYDTNADFSWKDQTSGKGQLFTQGTYGLSKLVAGGMYDQTTKCGSCARGSHIWPWDTTLYTYGVGSRFISDHINRNL